MCRIAWALLALAAAACDAATGFSDEYTLLWGSGLGYSRDSFFGTTDGRLHSLGKQAVPTGDWQRFGIRQLLVGSQGDVIVGITTTGHVVHWVQDWINTSGDVPSRPLRSHYAYINPHVTNATAIAVSKEGGLVAVGTLDGVVITFTCRLGYNPTLQDRLSVHVMSYKPRMLWSGLVHSRGAVRSISLSGTGDVIAVAHDWYVSVYTLVGNKIASYNEKSHTASFFDTHTYAGGIPAFVDAIHMDGAANDIIALLNDGTTRRVNLKSDTAVGPMGVGCDLAHYTEGVDYTVRGYGCEKSCLQERLCTGYQALPGNSLKCVLWLNGNCHDPPFGRWGVTTHLIHYTAVSIDRQASSGVDMIDSPCAKSRVQGVQDHCTGGKLFQLPLSQQREAAFLQLSGKPEEGVVTAVLSPTPSSEVFAYHVRQPWATSDKMITAGVPGLRAASAGSTLVVVHNIEEEAVPGDPQHAVVLVTLQFYTSTSGNSTDALLPEFALERSQVRFDDVLVPRGSVNPQEGFSSEDEALQPLLDLVATVQPFLAGERDDFLCRQLVDCTLDDSCKEDSLRWLDLASNSSLCPAGPVVLTTERDGSYADQYHDRMEEDVLGPDSTSTFATWCVTPPILHMRDRVAMPSRLFCMPPLAPLPAGAVCIDYKQQLDASLFCDKGTSCVVEGTRTQGHCREKSLSRVEVNVAASLHARTVAVSLTVDGETSDIKVFAKVPWEGAVPRVEQQATNECGRTNSRKAHTYMCHDGTYCTEEYCCRLHGGILHCPPTQPDLCSSLSCSDDCQRELLGKRSCYDIHQNNSRYGTNVIAYHTSLERYTYGDTVGRPCPTGYGPIMSLADCHLAALKIFSSARLSPDIDTVNLAGMPRCYVDDKKVGDLVLRYNTQGLATSRIPTAQRGLIRTLCRAAQYVVLGNSDATCSGVADKLGLHQILSEPSCQEAVESLNLHSAMESGPATGLAVYSWGGRVESDSLPRGCFKVGRMLKYNSRQGDGSLEPSMRAVCSITPGQILPPDTPISSRGNLIYPHAALYAVMFGLLGLLSWVGLIFAVRHSGVSRARAQQQRPTGDEPLLDAGRVEGHKKRYIDLLQTLVVSLDPEDEAAQGQCSVCLDDLQDAECVQLTACGHHLHHECLRDYIVHLIQKRRRRTPRCPNCRSKILLNGGDDTDGSDADSASGQNDDETSSDTQEEDDRTDDSESRAAAAALRHSRRSSMRSIASAVMSLMTPTPAAPHQGEADGEAIEMTDMSHSFAGADSPELSASTAIFVPLE